MEGRARLPVPHPQSLLLLEALVYGLAVLCSQRDLLVLFAQLLLNERESVVARRQALDFVLALFVSYRIERALYHVDVHPHPRMLVTLHGQHDLFAREALLDRSSGRRLRLVPFTIACGVG